MELIWYIIIFGGLIDVILIILGYKYYPYLKMWLLSTIYKIEADIKDIKRELHEHRKRSEENNRESESIGLQTESDASKQIK